MGDYLEIKLAGGQSEPGVIYVGLRNAALVGEGCPVYVARAGTPKEVHKHQVIEPCPPSMVQAGIFCIHRYVLYAQPLPVGEEVYLL